jgi:hypothetical protein
LISARSSRHLTPAREPASSRGFDAHVPGFGQAGPSRCEMYERAGPRRVAVHTCRAQTQRPGTPTNYGIVRRYARTTPLNRVVAVRRGQGGGRCPGPPVRSSAVRCVGRTERQATRRWRRPCPGRAHMNTHGSALQAGQNSCRLRAPPPELCLSPVGGAAALHGVIVQRARTATGHAGCRRPLPANHAAAGPHFPTARRSHSRVHKRCATSGSSSGATTKHAPARMRGQRTSPTPGLDTAQEQACQLHHH